MLLHSLLDLPPLFFIAGAYTFTIYLQSILNSVVMIYSATTIGCGILLYFKKEWLPHLLLLMIISFYGITHYQSIIDTHNLFINKIHNRTISITGVIENIYTTENQFCPLCVTLEIKEIISSGEILYGYPNKIVLYTSQNPELHVGDRITIANVRIKPIFNESFTTYLIKENILTTLFIKKNDYTVYKMPMSLNRFIFEKREKIVEKLLLKMDTQTRNLFSLLFLGNKRIKKNDLNELSIIFKKWGISHYLARSGLHLIAFVYIWQKIFSLIPIPFIIKQIIILIISFIYLFFTWSSISFLRAFFTFFIIKICLLQKKTYNSLNVIALVVIIFLLHNPLQLFSLDFQLSFALTCALAWYNRTIKKVNY